jgi:hypothetical protein
VIVDRDTDELITDGAHFLGMTKKDLVGEAVRAYLASRREEMRQAILDKLRKLDGSALLPLFIDAVTAGEGLLSSRPSGSRRCSWRAGFRRGGRPGR